MFNAKAALALIDQLRQSAEALATMPEVVPIAREIMNPVLSTNGHAESPVRLGTAKKTISEATRRKMKAAAQKRWRAKKAQGLSSSQSKVSKSAKHASR